MTISANIRARATGLLASFREDQKRVPAALNPSPTGPSGDVRSHISGGQEGYRGNIEAGGILPSGSSSEDSGGTHKCLSETDVRALIGWLNERVTTQGLSAVTARCYRRWLASYFESIGDPCCATIRNWVPPGTVEDALQSDEVDARNLATPGIVTSAKKMAEMATTNTTYLTYIDSDTLAPLLEQLISTDGVRQRYEHGPVTALFFTTSMMTGLRPMEWETARYRDTHFDPESKLTLGPVLDVVSLKQKNRRDDNPLRDRRYLVLDDWPDEQIHGLRTFLQVIADSPTEFSKLYGSMRKALTRAWLQVLKNNAHISHSAAAFIAPHNGEPTTVPTQKNLTGLGISPNTARHIFAEECRRSLRFTRYELASMLGHSMITNQVHYGPRQDQLDRGHSFVLPRPWPGDAEAIMEWDDMVNPRRNYYRQGVLDVDVAADDAARSSDVWDGGGNSTTDSLLKRF